MRDRDCITGPRSESVSPWIQWRSLLQRELLELPVSRQASFTYQNKPRLSADLRSTLVDSDLTRFLSGVLGPERLRARELFSRAHCRSSSSRRVSHCSKSSPTTAAAAARRVGEGRERRWAGSYPGVWLREGKRRPLLILGYYMRSKQMGRQEAG